MHDRPPARPGLAARWMITRRLDRLDAGVQAERRARRAGRAGRRRRRGEPLLPAALIAALEDDRLVVARSLTGAASRSGSSARCTPRRSGRPCRRRCGPASAGAGWPTRCGRPAYDSAATGSRSPMWRLDAGQHGGPGAFLGAARTSAARDHALAARLAARRTTAGGGVPASRCDPPAAPAPGRAEEAVHRLDAFECLRHGPEFAARAATCRPAPGPRVRQPPPTTCQRRGPGGPPTGGGGLAPGVPGQLRRSPR
ncbi:hypothetical protein HBB16_19570 [Pseudonocardia sp. MCCB 268]|nr:hypothetical protein [Pseudonocardia cytotoxica]